MHRLLVWDTETGGLDPEKSSILTVGAVVWEDGKILDEILIRVAEPVIIASPRALAVNGIDIEELQRTGLTPLAAVSSLAAFCTKNGMYKKPPIGGHNVPFDVGFMKRLYRLAGRPFNYDYHFIDTMAIAGALRLAGRLPVSNLKLDTLAAHFGIKIRDAAAHDALQDARATAHVLTALVGMLRNDPVVGPDATSTVVSEAPPETVSGAE